MTKALMSEAEQRRRQKLQGKIGRTTSTLGLSGVGLTGAAILTHKKPGTLKAITKVPGLGKLTAERAKNAAFHTSIAAGGIGGVGGFNQASIYSAESRRRKQAVPVKKSYGMEMGYYGEEGHPLTHEEIEAEIEKAWTPSASNFDAEKKRHKRSGTYQGAALAGAGAGGAYAAHHGAQAVHQAKAIKPRLVSDVTRDVNGTARVSVARANHYKAISTGSLKAVRRSAGKTGIGLAAVAGGAATHSAIKRKKQGGWQSYAKRDSVSAFGVDHDEVSKAFNPLRALKGATKAKTNHAMLPSEHFADPFKPGKETARPMRPLYGKTGPTSSGGMSRTPGKKPAKPMMAALPYNRARPRDLG